MNLETFQNLVKPLAALLKGVDLNDPKKAHAEIQRLAPFSGTRVQEIRQAMAVGLEDGWLLTRENGGIRFGRVAKDLEGFSVDAVLMNGPGPRHRHGEGEIDLCFATNQTPCFDNQAQGGGWVIYPPNSVHTPTVTSGEMLILYFLPNGSIEFL